MATVTKKRSTFRDNKIKQIVKEDQVRYNEGLIQMARGNYEESETELQRCLRLRVFMYGPHDHRVAMTHEALGDLKSRMLKDKETDSSLLPEHKDSAINHYQAALRSIEKEFCEVPDEEMREILQDDFKSAIDRESGSDRRKSVSQMIKDAEDLSNKMKLRSSGISVESDTKSSVRSSISKTKIDIVRITKRVMTHMKQLQEI